jgi:cell division protein FtsA
MTQDPNILAAVDVGTTKVCTIIARREGDRYLRVLSHSVAPSQGLQRGNVTDVAEAGGAIRDSIQQAARQSSATVNSVYVGITGSHVSFENRSDQIDWAATRGVITRDDLNRVPHTVADASERRGHTVIHALPRYYTLDRQSGIRDPLGMHTRRLEVASHVVSAETFLVRNLTQAMEQTGLRIEAFVLGPVASAEAVLSEDEKLNGVVLVDIGGGTSDIIVFERGTVAYTSVLPVGGSHFTNDICVTYRTTYEAAESAKLEHGTTEPATLKASDEIVLPVQGRERQRQVALRDLSQLMRERAVELARMIRIKMAEAGIRNPGASAIVLTGGSSRLPGLEGIIQKHLCSNTRTRGPGRRLGVPEELRQPEFATAAGILLWAIRNSDTLSSSSNETTGQPSQSQGSGPPRLIRWLFPG